MIKSNLPAESGRGEGKVRKRQKEKERERQYKKRDTPKRMTRGGDKKD